MSRPAVFIDRDGTLTKEVGYVNHEDRIELEEGAGQAVAKLNRLGIPVVVITNQAGAARGYFSMEVLIKTRERLYQLLADFGAHLDGYYYCPHHPNGIVAPYNISCDCRKPKPGMILTAARDLDLDLKQSYMAGDKYEDLQLAWNAGTKAIMVKTGYGLGELTYKSADWQAQPDYIAKNLAEAVDWILSKMAI